MRLANCTKQQDCTVLSATDISTVDIKSYNASATILINETGKVME